MNKRKIQYVCGGTALLFIITLTSYGQSPVLKLWKPLSPLAAGNGTDVISGRDIISLVSLGATVVLFVIRFGFDRTSHIQARLEKSVDDYLKLKFESINNSFIHFAEEMEAAELRIKEKLVASENQFNALRHTQEKMVEAQYLMKDELNEKISNLRELVVSRVPTEQQIRDYRGICDDMRRIMNEASDKLKN